MPNSTPQVDSPIQVYQDSTVAPPRASGWPMNEALFKEYVGTEIIVTFLALVPLETLVNGGIDGLNEYCQQAFADFAEMQNTEYRAVPSDEVSHDDWNERLDGDVALQVTCTLASTD